MSSKKPRSASARRSAPPRTASPPAASPPGARWLLGASYGSALLGAVLIGIDLVWDGGPHAAVITAAGLAVVLSALSVWRLRSAAPSAALALLSSACLLLALGLRQQTLEHERQALAQAREATQRASINAFEVKVRALVERQRAELEALKAGAHSWDEPTRERVRLLEVKFQEAARDAEQLILEQRRQLSEPAAQP